MESRQLSQLTRCLWEFQEMTLEIDGLMLISVDGGVLASTIGESEAANRVAAVVMTLIGLARQTSEGWNQGDFHELRVRYKDDSNRLRDAQLIAVSEGIALVLVLERAASYGLAAANTPFNMRQALHYLTQILQGEENPPNASWM